MGVNLSGLEHFKSTLTDVKRNISSSKKNPKIKRIIDIAKQELKQAYMGKAVKISVEKSEHGFTIYVKDLSERPTIAFDEFGTGFYATKYPGNLPTQRISFESAGYKQKTNGWEYYYKWKGPKEKNPKKTHGGMKGWVTPNGTFHIGQNPSKTMYNACKRIIERVRSEIK